MTRSFLALSLATAATAALGLSATPASATTETLYLAAGYHDRYGDFHAEGLTNVNVQVYEDRGVWKASVFRRVDRRDPVTGVFHAVTESTAGRSALTLPAGAVHVSDNEHTITVEEVSMPIRRTVSTSAGSTATTDVTEESTVFGGTFQIAGGNDDGYNYSSTFTPAFDGCESADHYEDTDRRSVADVLALGTRFQVEPGSGKKSTAEAAIVTFRLRGTENC